MRRRESMHWEYLLNNYEEAVAMILFGIGFSNLLLQKLSLIHI